MSFGVGVGSMLYNIFCLVNNLPNFGIVYYVEVFLFVCAISSFIDCIGIVFSYVGVMRLENSARSVL